VYQSPFLLLCIVRNNVADTAVALRKKLLIVTSRHKYVTVTEMTSRKAVVAMSYRGHQEVFTRENSSSMCCDGMGMAHIRALLFRTLQTS